MTDSTFDVGEDELGSDNLMRRSIEDAIAHERQITLGEYSMFMTSIGGLVPGFVIRSVPMLLFPTIRDSIKCTNHAIAFIKSHPSLPVSFNVKAGIQSLHDCLKRQETFAVLQSTEPTSGLFSDTNWSKFRNSSITEAIVNFSKMGKVNLVRILLERHYTEIKTTTSIVNDILALFPVSVGSERELISLTREVIVPHEFELESLVEYAIGRSRIFGEMNDGIQIARDWISVIDDPPTESDDCQLETPLTKIRSLVRRSEKEDIEIKIAPIRKCLDDLLTLGKSFGIHSVTLSEMESDRESVLNRIGEKILHDALELIRESHGDFQMEIFESYTQQLIVNGDVFLFNQIKMIKEWLSRESGTVPPQVDDVEDAEITVQSKRSKTDPKRTEFYINFLMLYHLLTRIQNLDIYMQAIYEVVIALPSISRDETTEIETAIETMASNSLLNANGGGYYHQLLSSYLSVLSIQKSLLKYEDFQFIKERADFLMNRSNVMFIVNRLCCDCMSINSMADAIELGRLFPYIDESESWLTRLGCLYYDTELDMQKFTISVEEVFSQLPVEIVSHIATEFATLILDDNVADRLVAIGDVLSGIVFPRIKCVKIREKLSKNFEKISLLFNDFGLRVSLTELEADERFASLDWFHANCDLSIVSDKCKFERVCAVFGFLLVDHEIGYMKSYDSISREFSNIKRTLNRASIDSFCEKYLISVIRDQSRPLNWEQLLLDIVSPAFMLRGAVYRTTDTASCRNDSIYQWGGCMRTIACTVTGQVIWDATGRDFTDPIMLLSNISKIDGGEHFLERKIYFALKEFKKGWLAGQAVVNSEDELMSKNLEVSNRVKMLEWGEKFDSFGLTKFFCENDLLLAGTVDGGDERKQAVKDLLNRLLPNLITCSGFDFGLCEKFMRDIGRDSIEDLRVTFLISMILADSPVSNMMMGSMIRDLFSDVQDRERIWKKLSQFLLPRIVNCDESKIRMFLSHCPCDMVGVQRMQLILDQIEVVRKIIPINISENFSFNTVIASKDGGEKLIIGMIQANSNRAEAVEGLMKLATICGVEKIVSKILLEKILSFIDLTIASGSVTVDVLAILVAALETEDERLGAVREVASKLPGDGKIRLALMEKFPGAFSDGEVLLMRNRVAVSGHRFVGFESEHEIATDVKRVIESMWFGPSQTLPIEDSMILTKKLIEINDELLNFNKFRIELVKKYSMEENAARIRTDRMVEFVRFRVAVDESEERIITVILKVFFASNIHSISFQILFRAFPLSRIRSMYQNHISDLVQIEKNLTYMKILDNAKILKSGLSYKEFCDIDKVTIVWGIMNHEMRDLEVVKIAAWIVVDYDLGGDVDILDVLEKRLLCLGINGVTWWHKLKHMLVVNAVALDAGKIGSCDGLVRENDENISWN